MKKNQKKLLSALLTLALVIGTCTTAFAANDPTSGTIEGDSTVTNPVFKFLVPTEVDFAFNPFEIGDVGSQITSGDLYVINKSSIPVQVSFDYKLTAASGVIVESSASDVTTTTEDKEMFMTAVPAATVSAATSGSALATTGSAITWSTSAAVLSTTGTDANITYQLDKANFTDADSDGIDDEDEFTSVDASKSVAAFRFKGALNPNAAWAASDATIEVAYTIKGVTTTAYGNFVADGGQNVEKVTSSVVTPAVDLAPSFTVSSATVANTAIAANYTVDLGTGTKKATGITSVALVTTGTNYNLTATTDYALSGTTFTLKKGGTFTTNVFNTKGTYTFRVVFNDTPATTKDITLTIN